MHRLPKGPRDPQLLVGYDTSDDAAVYQINDDIALIQTVDFFPPMVDDPYLFGQIAAANALSDIYAMGGSPKLAMNLLCFPSDRISLEDVQAILAGGADKVHEAGANLCGGHTIEDKEPKYGLCVTGFASPQRILTNNRAQIGDVLLLTKPLGSGILATAAKAQLLSPEQIAGLHHTMAALNAAAAGCMASYTPNACTDITGFGLVGHTTEMARASGVRLRIFSREVALLDGALAMASQGVVPGGAYRNREYLGGTTTILPGVSQALSDILFDPQTSGGLLISMPPAQAKLLLEEVQPHCPHARIIGVVEAPGEGFVIIE